MTEFAPKTNKDFLIWMARVDETLWRDFAINLEDFFWKKHELLRLWRRDPDPNCFVEWLAMKYDLISVDDYFCRPPNS